jgi:hypothetical protein
LDAALPIHGSDADVLMHGETERKEALKLEIVGTVVGAFDLKVHLEAESQ